MRSRGTGLLPSRCPYSSRWRTTGGWPVKICNAQRWEELEAAILLLRPLPWITAARKGKRKRGPPPGSDGNGKDMGPPNKGRSGSYGGSFRGYQPVAICEANGRCAFYPAGRAANSRSVVDFFDTRSAFCTCFSLFAFASGFCFVCERKGQRRRSRSCRGGPAKGRTGRRASRRKWKRREGKGTTLFLSFPLRSAVEFLSC